MALTSGNIHFTRQLNRAVWLSKPLAKHLQLDGRQSVNVKLGKDIVNASVRTVDREGYHMYMSEGLRQTVRIPKTGNVYLANEQGEELQIGPLIGVLTENGKGTPFGPRTEFVWQLLRLGGEKAYFFAFTPRDIDWESETIRGWFLDAKGNWIRRVVPFPDVVYNRFPNRRTEVTSAIRTLRGRLVEMGIPFFNWSYFNKSDVYTLLNNDLEALRHLPESVNNPTPEKMKQLLEKHQFLYYKPTAGSLGKGIYRLTYHPRRGYFVRYRRKEGNILLRFSNFNSLIKLIRARHGESVSKYVVQQGIRLVEMDNCPIDFRFHMHKDGNNQWVVAAIGAKKAGRGSVTTHVKNGGSLMTPEQALRYTFGDKAGGVLKKAKAVAIKLCESIERNFPHTLGELGLDIGIDRDGEIWMFEANAKPGRSIFKHPDLKEQGIASLQFILDHCVYLSKFRQKDNALEI